MPTISQFDGIVISMDYHDAPPPNIHALCGEFGAIVEIPSMTLREGCSPPRQMGVELVPDWAAEHLDELIENWRRVQDGMPLHPIAQFKPEKWSAWRSVRKKSVSIALACLCAVRRKRLRSES